MCDDCVKMASEIDPKLIELVDSIKDKLAALHVKIAPHMREIMQMVAIEANMTAEDVAEIEAMQNMFAGMMGLSYATAWFNFRKARNPMEGLMMGKSILEFTHRAIKEASAYNYVVNQVKH